MSNSRDTQSGALFEINGQVSNGSTWQEDIHFTEDGSPMDLTGLEFRLQIRSERGGSVKKTLSTSDNLSIETDTDSGVDKILRITLQPSSMTDLQGDYFVDLASKDTSGNIKHWGHGIISFIDDPVLW